MGHDAAYSCAIPHSCIRGPIRGRFALSRMRFLLGQNIDYPTLFAFDILVALTLPLVPTNDGTQRLHVLLLTPVVTFAFAIGFTVLLSIMQGVLR